MKRRTWLLSAAGAAGALVVGWSVLPARSRLGAASVFSAEASEVALNGWIKIAADGSVVLAMARSEMGQGVHTALPMLVAEELDVPLERVRIEQAGVSSIYGNVAMFVGSLPFHPPTGADDKPSTVVRASEWMVGKLARELGIQVTGGSSSLADAWDVLRMAAATARAALVTAAAQQWSVAPATLVVKDGVVSDGSGRSAAYAELARAAAGISPGAVQTKPRADWKLIGQSPNRLDVPAKVNGTARFGIDVRLPGMLYAAVRMCPMLGGTLVSVDDKAALSLPGVLRRVDLPAEGGATAGLAIVASSWWQASQAVQALKPEWAPPAGALADSQAIRKQLEAAVQGSDGTAFYTQGDVASAQAGAAKVVEAVYAAPYLAHAAMEPMNCTAQVVEGRVEVWAPTQVPSAARDLAAKVAGVGADKVTLHVTLLGGGFGRRLDVDFVGQAVRVAMAANGKPVQLLWSREEDMGHDFYRPMHVARLRAGVDSTGFPVSLEIQSAGDAITPRWMARTLPALSGPVDLPDKTTAEGLFDQAYGIAHQRMAHVATRSGVPVGYWRSVGHSHNAFFIEGFIDELATAAKVDALVLRRKLLQNAPRHLAVLELAAAKAGWGTPLPAGRARGLAVHESFGSVVAQVVEVSIEAGRPRVHRVVCAVDCGTVVNPGIVAQQVESSVVFALTAALYGRIDIQAGAVRQRNFPDYPLLPLAQAPQVDTYIVPSDRPPSGMGEPAVPPLAPALASALFLLNGQRQRELPLKA
ncbi:MAG: molybdopterin cofactor-binding domain-containing protein [Pseudomonadota bacterium]